MPRTLSATAAASALAARTAEVWVVCLTISGEGLPTFRISTDNVPVERSVGTFEPFPFEVPLPDDVERTPGTVEVRICNMDRAVSRLLREYTGIPQATVEVVLASQPDVVERGPFDFTVKSAAEDEMVIALQLGHQESLLNSRVPAQDYNPNNSPALFP